MKITNLKIVEICNTLNKYGSYKLPQRISFAIIKNISLYKNEYDTYKSSLDKLIADYDKEAKILHTHQDNIAYNKNGAPKIKAKYENEFNQELADLLNIELDVAPYVIDESVFDYESSEKYTPLSPGETMELMSILCKTE